MAVQTQHLGMGIQGVYAATLGTYPQTLNGAVFSDHHPESDLTCNASGSRKRAREEHPMLLQGLLYPYNNQLQFADNSNIPVKKTDTSVQQLPLSLQDSRLSQSAITSTSGRTPVFAPQDIISGFNRQSIEIEALIRFQNEKLRYGLEEMRKKHCRSLLSELEQQVHRRLKEKDAEIQNVARRNAELEERLKQIAAENQIWFTMVKNNEAIVNSLRTSLEQALLLQNNINNNNNNVGVVKEGFGDSDGPAADDALSCCFESEPAAAEKEKTGKRRACCCKMCGDRDVRVLVLPCRHLCLCTECESTADRCPVCHSVKNATIQIFMS